MAAGSKWIEMLRRSNIISTGAPTHTQYVPFARIQTADEEIDAINYSNPRVDADAIYISRMVIAWEAITFILLREGISTRTMLRTTQEQSKWITLLKSKGIHNVITVTAGVEIEATHFTPYQYDNDFLYLQRKVGTGRTIEGVIPWDQITMIKFR